MSAFLFALGVILLAINNSVVLRFAEAAPPLAEINARDNAFGLVPRVLGRENQGVTPRGLNLDHPLLPRNGDHATTITVTSCETQPPTAVIPPVSGTTTAVETSVALDTPVVVVPPVSSGNPLGPPGTSDGIPPTTAASPSSQVPPGETTGPSPPPATGTLVTDSNPLVPADSTSVTGPAISSSTAPDTTELTTGTDVTASAPADTTTGQPPAPNSASASHINHGKTAVGVGSMLVAAALAVI